MKKVLVFGVFDLFHFGHLRLLQRARNLGDYLIVAVQDDEYVVKYKPPGSMESLYNTEERVEMIRSLRIVNEVIVYKTVADNIREIDFTIYVKGPDNMHEGILSAVQYCAEKNKEVVTLPRTDGISSTYIKRLLDDFVKGDINGQE